MQALQQLQFLQSLKKKAIISKVKVLEINRSNIDIIDKVVKFIII